ncbi:MAG: hypothetical protein HZA52_15145 [Planctomycetes bacterium]|nr:hypothetical protein [Planctomycetota bacterium]
MNPKLWIAGALVAGFGMLSFTQETPKATADTYGSLADTILAVKRTEANFVRALLDGHHHAALSFHQRGNSERASAEMSLFANEGDNAIGGVRKRLLEGGHHHNADGESKGLYEAGYVVVTKKAKEQLLAASAAMRAAKTDAERSAAWTQFDAAAAPLLKGK